MIKVAKNQLVLTINNSSFCLKPCFFRGIFVLLFLLPGMVSTNNVQGQDTSIVTQLPKQPYSFDHAVGDKIATETFTLSAEEVEKARKKSPYRELNMSDGTTISVQSDFRDIGTWEQLPNGDRLWRYKIHLTGAKGVGFNFNVVDIPNGGYLFFYNTEKTCLIGPFSANKMPSRINAIMGEEGIVEYYEPAATKGRLFLHSVHYRFADFPPSFSQKLPPPPIVMQPISEDFLRKVYDEFQKVGNIGGGLMQNFKHDLNDIGQWDELPNGDRIWRFEIQMKLATSVALGISKCKIPEGCQLFTYSSDHRYIGQTYTSKFREEWFWIDGNNCVIEYYEPAKQKGKSIIEFSTIDCVPYLGDVHDNSRDEDEFAHCNPNVVCADATFTADTYDGPAITTSLVADMTNTITTVEKSVMHLKTAFPCNATTLANYPGLCVSYPGTDTKMYVYKSNCTGALLCNNVGETYILSARHCVTVFPFASSVIMPDLSTEQSLFWEYDFNFQVLKTGINPTCEYTTSDPDLTKRIRTPLKIVAVSNSDLNNCYEGDYLLLKILPVPFIHEPYYAGFDASEALPLRGFGIHHPLGYNKKFSLQDDNLSNLSAIDKAKYDGIKLYKKCGEQDVDFLDELAENPSGGMFALTYDRGAVLGGSSGSPYFNANGLIIGQLNGGPIDCASSNDILTNNWNNNKVARYG